MWEAARRRGFQAVGAWSVEPMDEERALLARWLGLGYGASMHYLTRQAEGWVFSRPRHAWIRSVVVLLVRWDELHRNSVRPWSSVTASYARGPDYHLTVKDRLRGVAADLGFSRVEAHVDASVLPERAIARRAGVGWIGRNRFLIHPQLGGDVCIAELAVDVPLPTVEQPRFEARCGACRACLDACPTGALSDEGVDARRCVAFHTSQNRGVIPEGVRGCVTWILGCDDCLRACPYGLAAEPEPAGRTYLAALIMARTHEAFALLAGDGPLVHLGREASVRNAVVVAGARRMEDLAGGLADAAARDTSPVVRGHAAWALGRMGSAGARRHLDHCLKTEPDQRVRSEITSALDGLPQ